MATPKQSEPSLGLDRRQLLAATAVVTAPSDCVSLDSFLLCHWNHLGFFIVRLS
jgi:hypothetical protein